ncbi:MAG: sulfate adenylyltransferase subunit CysN [Cyanobacteria bacterium]|nr:sulfate adenylyltransferase subunit CysN [Cyanobacteriota bacterium]MDA1020566.1 sulfate adenylyltransferase subunit CysN [Cyanobacteriota bacterium]
MEDFDILRFTTVGSVDDGKSTLIGRLLYDSKGIFEDQLAAVQKTSGKKGFESDEGIDFALLTDGLAAEREQGITIDVAYRYFNTPKRKFIIADTPGHEQYTRNMVTGASTAHLTIILIDARKGIIDQSRRHTLISSLLGIPNFLIAVNKMDLVDYSQDVFNNIVDDFKDLVLKLDVADANFNFVPISALKGTNVVNAGTAMPWYTGPTILEVLEGVDVQSTLTHKKFRMPVQYVIRNDSAEARDYRGFAGQISSGVVQVGDELISQPSGMKSRVKAITSYKDNLDTAIARQSVTLVLEDEIDTSRGDMLSKVDDASPLMKEFNANLCWMSETKFEPRKKYILKHTSNKVKAMATEINYKLDINNYDKLAATELGLNDIANVSFKVLKPIAADSYKENRNTGSFILIDEVSNDTVAAGMILSTL